jgi:hypothetical protein
MNTIFFGPGYKPFGGPADFQSLGFGSSDPLMPKKRSNHITM